MAVPEAEAAPRRARSWRAELLPTPLAPNLLAGAVVSGISIILAVSLGLLVFTGDLKPYLPTGLSLAVAAALVLNLALALGSSAAGVVAGPQDNVGAITALAASAIAAQLKARGAPEALLPTVVAAMALTSIGTGVLFVLLGRFRAGGLTRFLPYPVVGGFMAGTGWLLLRGSIGVMAGSATTLANLAALMQAPRLWHWLAGAGIAVLLFGIVRLWRHYLALPLGLVICFAASYGGLALAGISLEGARAQGWLLSGIPSGPLWTGFPLLHLAQVRWEAVLGQASNLLLVALLAAVALSLNTTGLEISTQRDLDLDRELRVTGVANLVAGLFGGLAGYLYLGPTVLGYRMGGRSRLIPLMVAGACLLTLAGGAALLNYIPVPILGGVLFLVGLDFLADWLWATRRKLPLGDYVLIWVILLTIAAVGLLPGVGLGIVIAIFLFAVNYSRINVVKNELTGATQGSNVDRPRPHRQALQKFGDETFILRLQGYLFFGTANSLLARIRARAGDDRRRPLRHLVLDFRRVAGLDSSAAQVFTKLRQLVDNWQAMLVLTNLMPEIWNQLQSAGLRDDDAARCRVFENLDYGLEWCENRVLAAETTVRTPPLKEILSAAMPARVVPRLMKYLDRLEVAVGHALIRQGAQANELFLIESGEFDVVLEADAESIRLRTVRAGTVVGELAMYLSVPRTTSVVADQPSVVYRLTRRNLDQMKRDDPDLAAAFHEFVARSLAERLAASTRTVEALSQ
jgi:SulP family sulfate permease